VNEGVGAYAALQLERETTPIRKGSGFEVVERLLRLNEANENLSQSVRMSAFRHKATFRPKTNIEHALERPLAMMPSKNAASSRLRAAATVFVVS
jgi:hypothetical protein